MSAIIDLRVESDTPWGTVGNSFVVLMPEEHPTIAELEATCAVIQGRYNGPAPVLVCYNFLLD